MTRRRDFLAALACAPAAIGGEAYQPTLAAQAYVFTQVYPMLNQRMEDKLPEVLETLRDAGFHAVELTGQFFLPENTSSTVQSLMLDRLRCPIVYNGGVMHTAEGAKQTIDETLALAKRVKALIPIVAINFNANPKPDKEPKTDSELDVQADNLNKLAKELKKRDIRLYNHQHDPEMAQDAREWRHLLKNTDPKLIDFCLDVHWVFRGGQDPMAILKQALPRLASLHLRNSKNKIWTEDFGDGDVDYAAIAALLKQSAYRGYLVVELAYDKTTELTRPLQENLTLSRQYAEKVFGVKA